MSALKRRVSKHEENMHTLTDKGKLQLLTRESRSPATAKLSPGMGIGRDAD